MLLQNILNMYVKPQDLQHYNQNINHPLLNDSA